MIEKQNTTIEKQNTTLENQNTTAEKQNTTIEKHMSGAYIERTVPGGTPGECLGGLCVCWEKGVYEAQPKLSNIWATVSAWIELFKTSRHTINAKTNAPLIFKVPYDDPTLV